MGQCLSIIRPADTQPVPTVNLYLKQTISQGADGQDRPDNLRTDQAHNLNRQEHRRIHNALRQSLHITCIPQSFEDHIGIKRIPTCHLGHRHIRQRRLNIDRSILLIRLKPLRPPNRAQPRSVHSPKRTLSNQPDHQHGSQAKRVWTPSWMRATLLAR